MGDSRQDNRKLIEDLKIHQVELEAQAEELRVAQKESLESKDKYLYHYDYAPVGYLTLKKDGTVLDANLTATALLGLDRIKLIHSQFAKYVAPDFQDTLYFHINKVFETVATQNCEIRMLRSDGTNFWASLESIALHFPGKPDILSVVFSDITERKKAEEALRQTKDYLDNLFNYANAPIIVWNTEFEINRFNHAFERLTGLKAEEVLGKKLDVLFPDNSREESMELIRRTSVGERWEVVEIPILHRDGTVRVVLWNSATIYAPDGKMPIATIAQGQDISERKKAEEALKKSEKSLVEAQLIGHTGNWEWNIQNGEVKWSKGLYAIYKLDPDTFIPSITSFGDYVHPDDREFVNKKIAEVMSGGKSVNFDFRIILADSSIRFLNTVGEISAYDENRKPYLMVGINQDITERKLMEESLREKQFRLQVALESGKIGIHEWNILTNELIWDDRVYDFWGLPRGTPVTLDTFVKVIHPDDIAATQAAMEKALNPDNKSNYYTEFRMTGIGNGIQRWLAATGYIIFADKRPIRLIGATWDITERKKAEEELKRYSTELEASNEELEAFSYSVSHDLRAPLRSLDGFSQAVIDEYGDKLDDQGKDYLDRVRKSSQHMSDLINDLLKLSRLSRAEIDIQKVNLSEIAKAILEDLKNTQPERKAEFVVSPGITALGDKPLLTVALQNLLGNSWKFTGKSPQARIEFGVTEQNGEKVYFVKDNGAGFNMRYSDKLFQPFQRLHSNKEFEGTGIGLAIAQRVIRRHGGRIWAESEEGKGATFYFTLN